MIGYILVWMESLVVLVSVFILIFYILKSCKNKKIRILVWIIAFFLVLFILGLTLLLDIGVHVYFIGPAWLIPYSISLIVSVTALSVFLLPKLKSKSSFLPMLCLFTSTWALGFSVYIIDCNLVEENNRIIKRSLQIALKHQTASILPEINAFPIYEDLFKPSHSSHEKWGYKSPLPGLDPCSREVESVLAEYGPTLSAMRKATCLPECSNSFTIEELNYDYWPWHHVWAVCNLCGLAAANQACKGDTRQALNYLRDANCLTERIFRLKCTMNCPQWAVRLRYGSMARLERVMYLAPGGYPDDAYIRDWKSDIPPRDLRANLDLELAADLHYLRTEVRYFSRLVDLALGYWPECHPSLWLTPFDGLTKPLYNFFVNYQMKCLEHRVEGTKKACLLPCNENLEAYAALNRSRPKDFMDNASFNKYEKPWKAACEMQTIETMEIFALAVWKYRTENGVYPSSLGDLIPEYLKEIPFSPLTGNLLQLDFIDGGVSVHTESVTGFFRRVEDKYLYIGAAYEKYRLNPSKEEKET